MEIKKHNCPCCTCFSKAGIGAEELLRLKQLYVVRRDNLNNLFNQLAWPFEDLCSSGKETKKAIEAVKRTREFKSLVMAIKQESKSMSEVRQKLGISRNIGKRDHEAARWGYQDLLALQEPWRSK